MTSRRIPLAAVTLALAALLALPRPALALFHLAVIDEVLSSYGGDASQQFVEIRLLNSAQNFCANSVLAAFDATGAYLGDLLVVPANVADGTTGRRWIMATSAFQSAHGFTADFTMTPGLPTGGGMVCWGAPNALPPPPASWDHTLLRSCSNDGFRSCTTNTDCLAGGFCENDYVDCLAYGSYAGPANVLTGTPTTATADGHSLARVSDVHDNLSAFACAPALTPTNDAGGTVTVPVTTCCEGAVCDDADGNPCTTGLCTGGLCVPTLSSGAPCDDGDGDPCTNGLCQSGACVSATQPQPGGCFVPALPHKSSLVIKDNAVDTKDVVVWKWIKGVDLTTADFGNPVATDPYTLCVYERTGPSQTPALAFKLRAPAGGTCPTKPCWKTAANGLGFSYADALLTPDGLRALVLKSGVGTKAKVTAKGLGPLLGVGGIGLPLDAPVTVQLHGAGKCWEVRYTTPTVDTTTEFSAKD